MASGNRLKEILRQATEAAAAVPDDLRKVAFEKTFDLLSASEITTGGDASASDQRKSEVSRQRKDANKAKGPAAPTLEEGKVVASVVNTIHERAEFGAIESNILDAKSMSSRVLLCFYFADEVGIPELGTAEIEAITKHLRVPIAQANAAKVIREQIQRYLTAGGVRRRGKRATYRINRAGRQEFERIIASTEPAAGPPPATAKRAQRRRSFNRVEPERTEQSSRKSADETPAMAMTRANGNKGRPGGQAAVRSLLNNGFFTKPRTIASMIEHLTEHRAHRYKANELSPGLLVLLRQGTLKRSRNVNNQYEYVAS